LPYFCDKVTIGLCGMGYDCSLHWVLVFSSSAGGGLGVVPLGVFIVVVMELAEEQLRLRYGQSIQADKPLFDDIDEKSVKRLSQQAQSNLNTYSPGTRYVEVRAELLKRVCGIAQGALDGDGIYC
jgi:hypothetical protein